VLPAPLLLVEAGCWLFPRNRKKKWRGPSPTAPAISRRCFCECGAGFPRRCRGGLFQIGRVPLSTNRMAGKLARRTRYRRWINPIRASALRPCAPSTSGSGGWRPDVVLAPIRTKVERARSSRAGRDAAIRIERNRRADILLDIARRYLVVPATTARRAVAAPPADPIVRRPTAAVKKKKTKKNKKNSQPCRAAIMSPPPRRAIMRRSGCDHCGPTHAKHNCPATTPLALASHCSPSHSAAGPFRNGRAIHHSLQRDQH